MVRRRSTQASRTLLIGAGTGEATCGILYLASYLRRNGVEAYVRLCDTDETDEEITLSLKQLVAHVQPAVVGISLKWFHHVARALRIAKVLRRIDPQLRIVLGGNTASYFWRELIANDAVDDVLLGDGEVPLLALCRNEASPPNVVSRPKKGKLPARPPLGYVQGTDSADVYYSHFNDIFLSQLDLHSFSGWVAPGKGCGENCLYCSGTRGMQKATFGRATPFLRPEASVQRDHREIADKTWQLRYDFAGSTAEFLERSWDGVDLSRHSTTYFLWGVPPPQLASTLSRCFARVHMVLDIGCFSQTQRLEQMKRGLLKPCPTDEELRKVIALAQRHSNLQLEISGIAGLPFASTQTLKEERTLVKRVIGLGCAIGYQRLEAQPGALVTEHPERFEMATEARTFAEFLAYFERLNPSERTVPMIRYRDPALERAVQATSDEVDALVWEAAEKRSRVTIKATTRLKDVSAASSTFSLGDWLGEHRVPPSARAEQVTVVRAVDGAGLTCVPSLPTSQFEDAALQQGETAAAILSVLAAFKKTTSVDDALARLRSQHQIFPDEAREIIEQLAAGRFLAPR